MAVMLIRRTVVVFAAVVMRKAERESERERGGGRTRE
jgi:hypothetical protein